MKYIEKIQELCKDEFEDYGFTQKYEIEYTETYNDYEFYTVVFKPYSDTIYCNDLKLKASAGDIQDEVGEDSWYMIETFDWTIKYLWIALLLK